MNPEVISALEGFNPYRVFKFVATLSVLWGSVSSGKFQSLSGFQVRCNAFADADDLDYPPSFNPYRVFKFVATMAHVPRLGV